jgi:glycosyltransferase involved in cell wall biosynthesis
MSVKVSIVIPTYNTTAFIAEALDSVSRQTYTDFETIVVNDGSPDSSDLERVLEAYRGDIIYIRKSNGGLASARNAGIEAAFGSLIAFLDADDTWDPNFLQVMVGMFEKHDVDVVWSNARMFGDKGPLSQTLMEIFPTNGEVTFETILSRKAWVFCCCVVRTETLLRVGAFDPNLRYAEDLDLWLRIAHAGGKFLPNPDPLVRYRRWAGSLTADYARRDQDTRARIALYERLLDKLDLSAGQESAVRFAIELNKAEITGLKRLKRKTKETIRLTAEMIGLTLPLRKLRRWIGEATFNRVS